MYYQPTRCLKGRVGFVPKFWWTHSACGQGKQDSYRCHLELVTVVSQDPMWVMFTQTSGHKCCHLLCDKVGEVPLKILGQRILQVP